MNPIWNKFLNLKHNPNPSNCCYNQSSTFSLGHIPKSTLFTNLANSQHNNQWKQNHIEIIKKPNNPRKGKVERDSINEPKQKSGGKRPSCCNRSSGSRRCNGRREQPIWMQGLAWNARIFLEKIQQEGYSCHSSEHPDPQKLSEKSPSIMCWCSFHERDCVLGAFEMGVSNEREIVFIGSWRRGNRIGRETE